MSIAAIQWAKAQTVGSSSRKAVLKELADYANVNGEAWPSIDTISACCELNRKTVIAALAALQSDGFIQDTGKREGTTGQIPVYRLVGFSPAMNAGHAPRNSPVSGIVAPIANDTAFGTVKQYQKRNSSKIGTVPVLRGNSPNFSAKQSRFRTVTVPKTGHEPLEPSMEPLVEPEDRYATPESTETTPVKSARLTAPKATRLPDDWEPDADAVLSMESECRDLDMTAATREFADYWRGVPNPKGLKADWLATWRNDMREKNRRGTFRRSRAGLPQPVPSTCTVPNHGVTLEELTERNAQRRGERTSIFTIDAQPIGVSNP